jgi:P-type conjugative transfer protein TrbJ
MRLIIPLIGLCSFSVYAFPVYDFLNGVQNTSIIANQLDQLRNQVNQNMMQAEHYKDIITNAKTNMQSLKNFQWDNANQVINNILESTNTIDYYKQEAGSLQKYLDRFQSTEFYKKGRCFNGGCTQAELQKIQQNRIQASVAEKRANDAMLKGIDKQQINMKKDAEKLATLQSKAQTAEGEKQALQAAAQLASNQSHQLLQIRGLLLAQQNSEATRYAVQANKEAIKEAGDERFRQGSYTKSAHMKW